MCECTQVIERGNVNGKWRVRKCYMCEEHGMDRNFGFFKRVWPLVSAGGLMPGNLKYSEPRCVIMRSFSLCKHF